MFVFPVKGGYKQRDHAPVDNIANGELWRDNWLNNEYDLLGTIPSRHTGDDVIGMGINCFGMAVFSVAAGTVTYAHDVVGTTWRKLVVIQHTSPDGSHVYSRYAHLKDMLVGASDTVQAGQLIGHIGNAEGRLASHLHFDLCITNLLLINPTNWPSTGRTDDQAKQIISANYTDPLEYIKARLLPMTTVVDAVVNAAPHVPVYQVASLSSPVVRYLKPGDVVQVDSAGAQIDAAGGMKLFPTPDDLWLAEDCLTLGGAPKPVTRYVTAQPYLNVRKSGSVVGMIVGKLAYGIAVQVDVTQLSSNGYVPLASGVGWCSNLYLSTNPPVIIQPQQKPVAYSRHSVHYMAGGDWDYWAAILRQRAAMGKPVPGMLICSMNWSGEPTPEMAIQAGALEVIWRDYPGESRWAGWQDVQGSYQAGYDFVLHCRLPAGSLDKTFIQILNEPTAVGPGTASYWNGAMDGAKVRSASEKRPVRLAVGCFPWGFPDYSFWPSFFDVLRRVRDEGHRFMLHQYRPDPDNDAGASQAEFIASVLSPDAGLRHQKIYALFPADLKTLPLALGEFLSKVATRIPPDWYRAAIQAYSAAIANDPIIYLCHWTDGTGGGAWKDSDLYNDKVDAIGTA